MLNIPIFLFSLFFDGALFFTGAITLDTFVIVLNICFLILAISVKKTVVITVNNNGDSNDKDEAEDKK